MFSLVKIKTNKDTKKQINPAKAIVVNFGVSIRHLKLTENTEKPRAEAKPKNKPVIVFSSLFPNDIIIIPIAANIIETHTLVETFSFKNKKPNKAVINGIAAKQRSVIAAVVLVIDQIKVIMAMAKPHDPISPEDPIFL